MEDNRSDYTQCVKLKPLYLFVLNQYVTLEIRAANDVQGFKDRQS